MSQVKFQRELIEKFRHLIKTGGVKVNVWESDSWSGQELLESLYFVTKEDAIRFVVAFNGYNNRLEVPEYYQFAELC